MYNMVANAIDTKDWHWSTGYRACGSQMQVHMAPLRMLHAIMAPTAQQAANPQQRSKQQENREPCTKQTKMHPHVRVAQHALRLRQRLPRGLAPRCALQGVGGEPAQGQGEKALKDGAAFVTGLRWRQIKSCQSTPSGKNGCHCCRNSKATVAVHAGLTSMPAGDAPTGAAGCPAAAVCGRRDCSRAGRGHRPQTGLCTAGQWRYYGQHC